MHDMQTSTVPEALSNGVVVHETRAGRWRFPRRVAALAAVLSVLSLWPVASVLGQDLPPGPTPLNPLTRLAVSTGSDVYDEAQVLALDFAPGRWTPRHSHGGLTLVRVLEGEITVRNDEGEQVFQAGEGWVEQPGDIHAAGNVGTEMARVQVTFLLPAGAPLTTVEGTPSERRHLVRRRRSSRSGSSCHRRWACSTKRRRPFSGLIRAPGRRCTSIQV